MSNRANIDAVTRMAMTELFSEISEGVLLNVRKHRDETPEDLKRAVRIADDEVYATYGHRIAELFLV